MKKIKDPALFRKIRDYLIDYLPVIRGKSLNTVAAYKITLNLYLEYLQQTHKKSLHEITINDFNQKNILGFLDWIKSVRKNCTSTRNQRLVYIRQFCKYLMGSDMLSFDELAQIQKIAQTPDPKKDELEYLTIEETRLILKQPDTNKKTGIRDRFFLALLYDSGCRDQEMLDLRLKDFFMIKDSTELHIVGKGRKYRVTPISKEVQSMFDEYCALFHQERNLDES